MTDRAEGPHRRRIRHVRRPARPIAGRRAPPHAPGRRALTRGRRRVLLGPAGGRQRSSPTRFDRRGDLALPAGDPWRPDIVVDASGPFQIYGRRPLSAGRGPASTAGVDYVDLADGCGLRRRDRESFDAEAKRRGVAVLSGASSFPVLTASVVRHPWRATSSSVATIVGGIAPSPFAGVGLNVVRAVAGYAGQSVDRAPARWTEPGPKPMPLTETRRYTIAPPGRIPLHDTLFSLVDVPGPRARAARLSRETRTGLDGRRARARRLPPHVDRPRVARAAAGPALARVPLAPLFLQTSSTGCAGASIAAACSSRLSGTRSRRRCRDGQLAPPRGGNRMVPSSRPWPWKPWSGSGLRARTPGPGRPFGDRCARPRPTTIVSSPDGGSTPAVRRESEHASASLPLYMRLLGPAWARLPGAVKALHGTEKPPRAVAEGRADDRAGTPSFRQGPRPGSSGSPPRGVDVPVSVRHSSGDAAGRNLGAGASDGHAFRAAITRSARDGRWRHLLLERFGPVTFGLALVADEDGLHFVVRRWSVLGDRPPAPAGRRSRLAPARAKADGLLPLRHRPFPPADRPHRPLPGVAAHDGSSGPVPAAPTRDRPGLRPKRRGLNCRDRSLADISVQGRPPPGCACGAGFGRSRAGADAVVSSSRSSRPVHRSMDQPEPPARRAPSRGL